MGDRHEHDETRIARRLGGPPAVHAAAGRRQLPGAEVESIDGGLAFDRHGRRRQLQRRAQPQTDPTAPAGRGGAETGRGGLPPMNPIDENAPPPPW